MASKGDPVQGVGNGAADGTLARKAAKFERDIGSAATFVDPGIQDKRRPMLRVVHRSTANVSMAPVFSFDE